MVALLCSIVSNIGYTKHLLLVSIILTSVTAQTCYWPNGNIAADYISCNEAAAVSNCCNLEAVCLDNGFCMDQKSFGNRLKRGACTDKSYGTGCTQTCADVQSGGQMSLLLVGDFDPGTYCCGNIVDSKCQFSTRGSDEPFSGPANGAVIYNRATGSTEPNSTIESTVTITVTSAGSTATGTCTATSSPVPNNGIAIGAGVGAPLGISLIAVAALLFIQIRRRKDVERQLQALLAGPGPMELPGEQKNNYYGHDTGDTHERPILAELRA